MKKDVLIERLKDMERVALAFNMKPFDIYFLGGSACLLGDYTDRGTRDFNFIDQDYPASYGKLFAMLRDFDMLEIESSTIATGYKERAMKLDEFNYINVFVLSKEDIIVSKIVRLIERDFEDIEKLIMTSKKEKINELIENVLARTDLYESKKEAFKLNLKVFKEKFNV